MSKRKQSATRSHARFAHARCKLPDDRRAQRNDVINRDSATVCGSFRPNYTCEACCIQNVSK